MRLRAIAALGLAVAGGGCGGDLEVKWMLWDKYFMEQSMNMFSQTCGQAQASEIVFTVRNEVTKEVVATTESCPESQHDGRARLFRPQGAQLFSVCAKLVRRPMSASQRVMGAMFDDDITVTIYGLGCDLPACDCP